MLIGRFIEPPVGAVGVGVGVGVVTVKSVIVLLSVEISVESLLVFGKMISFSSENITNILFGLAFVNPINNTKQITFRNSLFAILFLLMMITYADDPILTNDDE